MTNKSPVARKVGLLSEMVGDETVVFDRTSQKAFRLNRSAAIVWRHCDGRTSIEDLAALLQRELPLSESAEPLVEIALQKLDSLGLLEGPPGVTRRGVTRKIAAAAALIPAIAAITIPTPAKAASATSSSPAPSPSPSPAPGPAPAPQPAPAPSDQRLKKDVSILEHAIENIEHLRGVAFNWRSIEEREVGRDMLLPVGEPQIGLIAQDVERVFPEAVVTGSNGVKSVNYGALVGPLVEAIKAQQRELSAQKQRIERQQEDIDDLKRAFSAMEDSISVAR